MIKKMQALVDLQILSKEDQKMVKGGVTLKCECNDFSNKYWIGEYDSYKDAEADFPRHCGNRSAICMHVEI
ncbi:hypothetical protein [Alistipes sp. ZOR0009]|jgi:hypothetical protein|uniref:hypothetical protein n=1 Tax=Alistipes sp. ZOR0009 TaxID=1339253 RepID=UPI000647342E|nr:hypothetical protein [Alistipes sp. ZOR0009]